VLNLKLEIVSEWKYSVELPDYPAFLALQIEGDLLYLTVGGFHQIFLHKRQDGKLLNQWGTKDPSSKQGEFNYPRGITVDNKYVFVCDWANNRVQLLKPDGVFCTQWGNGIKSIEIGQFSNPFSIYNDLLEEIVYIADSCSVQLFRKDGVCIQRLGTHEEGREMNEFSSVFGMYVMDDRMYVSDANNSRIQIFIRS